MPANTEIERLIECFESAIEGGRDYPIRLIGLAQVVANKRQPVRAFELCRKALEAGAGDPEVAVAARRLLSTLIPRYHVPMMNDARRAAAWRSALGRAIDSSTRALEIGTGAGTLAVLAARAGAARVTTCERDPVLALIAREIVERNGFAERIDIIAKPSAELVPGIDVEQPADLLFCDNFGDSLFNFEPLSVLADARRRLTRPDAVVIPAGGAIRLALANWQGYRTYGRIDHAADIDLTPFAAFVPAVIAVPIGDPGLRLISPEAEAFRFDFAALSHPTEGRAELDLEAAEDAEINGIVHWIRLQLDARTILEARPEPGAISLSSPRFWPLLRPVRMRRGETLHVAIAHDGKRLTVWPT